MAQDMAQEMPQEGGEQPAEGGGAEQFASLVQNVTQGLAMLQEVIADSGVNPQVAEMLAQANGLVDQAIQGMQGGAAEGQGDQGMAAMEAGGANAQPMSPATR